MYSVEEVRSFLGTCAEQYLDKEDDYLGFYMEIVMNAKDEEYFEQCIEFCNECLDKQSLLNSHIHKLVNQLFDDYYPGSNAISYWHLQSIKHRVLEFAPDLKVTISDEEIYDYPDARKEELDLIDNLVGLKEQHTSQQTDDLVKRIDSMIDELIDNIKKDNVRSGVKKEIIMGIERLLPDTILTPTEQEKTKHILRRVEKLHKAGVLLGLFTLNRNHRRGDTYGTITLYPKSIKKAYACSEIEGAKSVFMHELFHAFHHMSLSASMKQMDKNEYKWKIVKESLASYYQYTYTLDILKNKKIANAISNDWDENDIDVWPYTGASYINRYSTIDADVFKKIFKSALADVDRPYSAIIACHELLESEEYKLLSGL